jgi:hypothetical protein
MPQQFEPLFTLVNLSEVAQLVMKIQRSQYAFPLIPALKWHGET